MDKYYEEKKRQGLILTLHNFDPRLPYDATNHKTNFLSQIEPPDGMMWWSHLSGRYRDSDEQKEYYRAGHKDRKLPKKR